MSQRLTGKATTQATASAIARLPQNNGSRMPRRHRPGDGQHDERVGDFHHGDRDRVRGERQAERPANGDPGRSSWRIVRA